MVFVISALFILGLGLAFYLYRSRQEDDPPNQNIEDCLKWLFKASRKNRVCLMEELGDSLHFSAEDLNRAVQDLVNRGWIRSENDGLVLTDAGSEYALQVIRAHRLAELHLADRTGISETEWHPRAEEWEHRLNPEEIEALSETLGHPTHDPHGDPIPTRKGRLFSRKSLPLPQLKPGQWGRIVHIEDEPEGVYERVVRENLHAGMQVQLSGQDSGMITFIAEDNIRCLDIEAALNLFVETISKEDVIDLSQARRLSSLKVGESGRIVLLSRACRGLERRRFLDLGLLPGSVVEVAFQNPGGNTIAYEVKGTLVALRREQADQILVESIEENAA